MFGSPTPKELLPILENELNFTIERFPRSVRRQLAEGHRQIMLQGGTLYDSAVHYAIFAVSHMRDPTMIIDIATACQKFSSLITLDESRKVLQTLSLIAEDARKL